MLHFSTEKSSKCDGYSLRQYSQTFLLLPILTWNITHWYFSASFLVFKERKNAFQYW